MGRLTFDGNDALAWLEHVTTNHVARLAFDQIQYSLMANGGGGLIDDVLSTGAGMLRRWSATPRTGLTSSLSSNATAKAATARLDDRTADTAMIAVQGPAASAATSSRSTTGRSTPSSITT